MSSRRIAVIGSGVAGLTAGYVLARTDDVTLFETDGRLGGHARTHQIPLPDGRELACSTGASAGRAGCSPGSGADQDRHTWARRGPGQRQMA